MAKNTKSTEKFEQILFKTADKLRKNIDAAEYKHVVLGLIFLKYISDAFEELYEKLDADPMSDPEDRDEYIAENVFFVPQNARWSELHAKAKLPSIGTDVDIAMEAVERENPELKGILAKVYAKPNLDKKALGDIAIGDEAVKGFCKSVTLEDIDKHNHVLTPGRYVGIPEEEDDGIPFEDKMKDLTTQLSAQMKKEKELDEEIKKQLNNIGFSL